MLIYRLSLLLLSINVYCFILISCTASESSSMMNTSVMVTEPLDMAVTIEPVDMNIISEDMQMGPTQDALAIVTSSGPYQVGYMSQEIDINNIVSAEARTVRVVLWYPTQDTMGTYASYPIFATRQVAWENASVALSTKAPILLYSHGSLVWPEMGAFMSEYFASHGWIVAAVEHTGNTLGNVGEEREDMIYAQRSADVSQTLDWLLSLESTHPLSGLADEDSIVVSGHSFGGYTAFALSGAHYDLDHLRTHCTQKESTLCNSLDGTLGDVLENGLRDERIKVSIPQSAGNFDFFRQGVQQVKIPTLMITATRDQACTEEGSNLPYWLALSEANSEEDMEQQQIRQQHRRLSFLQAGHATFTVACEHFPTLEQDDGCGEDFTPILEAQDVMLAHSLAFARWHLWQDEAAFEYLQNDSHRPEWTEWLVAP